MNEYQEGISLKVQECFTDVKIPQIFKAALEKMPLIVKK